MNKTVTVNIAGFIFNIEEEAFSSLQQYLEALRRQFKDEEGGEEIIQDIEARIAELFHALLNERKHVITQEDVDAVTAQLGSPADFAEESADTSNADAPEEEATQKASEGQSNRKLYRDEDDQVLAGVASGLSYYLGVDPVILRVGFVLAAFAGFGILTYIILWIAIPSAKTTSEKLRMKNQKINVDNIRQEIKSEARQGEFKKASRNFVDVLGELLKGIAKVFRAVFGVLFLSAAAFLILGSVYAAFGFEIFFDNDYFMSWDEIYEIFIPSQAGLQVGVVGGILILLAMIIGLVYAGLRMLKRVGDRYNSIRWIAPAALILGVILTSFGLMATFAQYSTNDEIAEEVHTNFGATDTLDITLINPMDLDIMHEHYRGTPLEYAVLKGETVYSGGRVALRYRPTTEDHMWFEIIRESDGKTVSQSRRRAENISYDYRVDSAGVHLSPYIGFPREDSFRGQEVEVNIFIPEGMVLNNGTVLRRNQRNHSHSYATNNNGHIHLLDAAYKRITTEGYSRSYHFY